MRMPLVPGPPVATTKRPWLALFAGRTAKATLILRASVGSKWLSGTLSLTQVNSLSAVQAVPPRASSVLVVLARATVGANAARSSAATSSTGWRFFICKSLQRLRCRGKQRGQRRFAASRIRSQRISPVECSRVSHPGAIGRVKGSRTTRSQWSGCWVPVRFCFGDDSSAAALACRDVK